MIGGIGEKKTLRLVAQYADACNLFAFIGRDALRHKLDVLKRHCDDVGRPYDAIEKTVLGTVRLDKQSPADVVAQVSRAGGARHPARHLQLPGRARDHAAADLREGSDPGGRRALSRSATRRFTRVAT